MTTTKTIQTHSIQIRVPDNLVKELDELARQWYLTMGTGEPNRRAVIRRILAEDVIEKNAREKNNT